MEDKIDIAKLLFKQNKYQETIDTCNQILTAGDNSIEAIKLIAKSFLATKKIEDARLYLNKALNITPDDYEIIKDIGNTYQAIGDIQKAINYYRKAIEIKSNYAPALTNLGALKLYIGRKQEALSLLIKATESDPKLSQGWVNLSNGYIKLDKIDDAEFACRKAIELQPQLFDFHFLLASILTRQKKLEEAVISLRKTIELQPDFFQAHINLGSVLKELGKLKEAEISTRKSIKLNPIIFNSHLLLSNILIGQKKYKEAEESLLKTIELKPDHASSYANLGIILRDLGKLKEAEIKTRKAIELNPYSPNTYSNLGIILRDLGNLKDAKIYLTKAIQIDPKQAEARYNLSLIHLKEKKFKEGWENYELRPKIIESKVNNLVALKPEWNPEKRGRVLVWGEQGIGDQILFASLIPDLLEKIDQLILLVDKRLIPLFERSFKKGIIYLSECSIQAEAYDYQIAIGSLPQFFRNHEENFKKRNTHYLQSDPRKSNILRNKLKVSKNKKIVGISWESTSKLNKHKSIALEEFVKGIYSEEICLLNLQYGNTNDQINHIKEKFNIEIIDIAEIDLYNNIDDLASLISACDYIVSIDNVTAILAGAISSNCQLLLQTNSHWYWGINDITSYWFSSIKLYRQNDKQGWNAAFKDVKNILI